VNSPGAESDADAFYSDLFIANPSWSTPHPNVEEARRAAVILPLLSGLAREARRPLRIAEVGCGRGWLTNLVSPYGECVGVEPVAPVVEAARKLFPALRFEVGSATTLAEAGEAEAFDVVISSEVIEHVPVEGRDAFVADLRALLRADGSLILTTDRGELSRRWARRPEVTEQPEENWMTEREVRDLFERGGFAAEVRDRAYYEIPDLSLFHRLVAGPRLARLLEATRQRWLLDGLRFAASNCQVWLFRRAPAPHAAEPGPG
jgi:SAM-dependent methyltransferase